VNVLLVDDSRTFRRAVSRMLRSEPDIENIFEAADGMEGVDEAHHRRPDLIVMDLEMPQLDGYGAIDRIMRSEAACPIVVLSASVDGPSSYAAARCFEVGAVEVLRKPTSMTVGQFRRRLVSVLRTMSKARVVRRGRKKAPPPAVSRPRVETPVGKPTRPVAARPRASLRSPGPAVLAIGSSTGGPPVLYELFKALPAPLPVPVIIAQHILPGFDAGLARWLSNTGHPVKLVEGPLTPEAGSLYLAPGDNHVIYSHGQLRLEKPKDGDMVPAADRLMQTLVDNFDGPVAGVVLTGMGRDGAAGLKAVRDAGGRTYAQSAETCAVNGMPQAARDLGAVEQSLSPADLGGALTELLKKR